MTTANDLVKGALRALGVLASGEEPAASDASDALSALNGMMSAFAGDGIDYAHIPLALADDVAMPPEQMEGLKYMLALRLAPEYPLTTPTNLGIVQRYAADGEQRLRAAYSEPDDMVVDRGLRCMPSRRWGW